MQKDVSIGLSPQYLLVLNAEHPQEIMRYPVRKVVAWLRNNVGKTDGDYGQ
ncbi:hypothetical protein NBRC116583_30750 [Arenicella sp. 4NH20-0111]